MIDHRQFQAFAHELTKVAVSGAWVQKMVQSGAGHAGPQRLGQFVSNMKDRALSIRQTRGTDLPSLLRGMQLEGKADLAGNVGREALSGLLR